MKKVFALILALCMVFALCACGQTAAPAATEAPAADTAADAAPAEDTGWAPDGPVTMIVAYKAGNGTDVTARVLALSTLRSTLARPSLSRTLTAVPAPLAGPSSPLLIPTA